MTVLILGGTTEATRLAALLHAARWPALLSYAGRTTRPVLQPIPTRTGGFGGVPGLAAFLCSRHITALVDATHPFAVQMTAQAAAAASETGLPHLLILRPPWTPQAGDQWTEHTTLGAAAAALGPAPRRVLLTVGQKDLAPFRATPHDFVVRSVEPIAPWAGAVRIEARGPFREADERALLERHRIEVVVTKNSGGEATRAKLDAARALGIPVMLVARPEVPQGVAAVPTAEAAFAWLEAHAGTLRGA